MRIKIRLGILAVPLDQFKRNDIEGVTYANVYDLQNCPKEYLHIFDRLDKLVHKGIKPSVGEYVMNRDKSCEIAEVTHDVNDDGKPSIQFTIENINL